ncbi:MAG: amino acid ABC transporter permease [Gordonia sp. (in: high G+C Gram-positive bacteria)]
MLSLAVLLHGATLTIILWTGAFTVAVLTGIPVCAARGSQILIIRTIGSCWVNVIRGVPPLVWIFILFFGVTIGTQRPTATGAAIVGLGLVGSAYMGEIYRGALDSIPQGQVDAIRALALGRWTALRSVRLPQCLPLILAAGASYGINLVKDTALASLIGVQEITFLANYDVSQGENGLTTFLIAGLAYLILSVPIGVAARAIEARGTLSRRGAA